MKTLFTKQLIIISCLLNSAALFSQLGGIKTIDPVGFGANNYTSVASAISVLNATGVAVGGVTFNVVSGGVFNEAPITISISINQPSPTRPILIQNAGTTPTINFTGTNLINEAGFKLVGTDNITFSGLAVIDAGINAATWIEYGFYGVRENAGNACQNISVQNCYIDLSLANTAASSPVGIRIKNVNAAEVITEPTSAAGVFSNNKFNGNTITEVVYGIWSTGSTIANFYDENTEVGTTAGNTIFFGGAGCYNISTGGIFFWGNKNGKIANNLIYTGAGNTRSVHGIRLSSPIQGTCEIFSNTVTISSDSASIYFNGIASAANSSLAPSRLSIHHNLIENCQVGQPAYTIGVNFSGISANSDLDILEINNNIVRNNTGNTPNFNGPGLPCSGVNNLWWNFVPIRVATGTVVTQVQTIHDNEIYGNNFKGHFAGVYVNANASNSGTNTSVFSNFIYNNTKLSSGSSHIVSGVFLQVSGANVYSNKIYNLQATLGDVSGVRQYQPLTATSNIYNNEIYNLTTQNGTAAGIYQDLSGGCVTANPGNVITNQTHRNKIYNLTSNSVSGRVYGIYTNWVANGSIAAYDNTIHNNFISNLNAPVSNLNPAITGICIGANSVAKVYFNSIKIKASSTGASFGTAGIFVDNTGTLTTLDSRNNLIVDSSVVGLGGSIVAFRTAAVGFSFYNNNSNYNSYFCGTPSAQRLIFSDGTNFIQTLPAYKLFIGAPREQNSISANPVFVSLNNLHTFDPAVAAMGISIAGFTIDIDTQTRLTPPTVGADEVVIFLPINVISFETICSGDNSYLTWSISENGKCDFTIDVSEDAVNFEKLGTVEGRRENERANTYSVTIDKSNKQLYYRLSLSDPKGQKTIFKSIVQGCTQITKNEFTIFPNPSAGGDKIILNAGNYNNSENVMVEIKDMTGKSLRSIVIEKSLEKRSSIILMNENELSPGIYFATFLNDGVASTKKLVVN